MSTRSRAIRRTSAVTQLDVHCDASCQVAVELRQVRLIMSRHWFALRRGSRGTGRNIRMARWHGMIKSAQNPHRITDEPRCEEPFSTCDMLPALRSTTVTLFRTVSSCSVRSSARARSECQTGSSGTERAVLRRIARLAPTKTSDSSSLRLRRL